LGWKRSQPCPDIRRHNFAANSRPDTGWTCTSSPRCRRSCLLGVPADGEAFPATTCDHNCQDPRKSAHELGTACAAPYSGIGEMLRLRRRQQHARCTVASCVFVVHRWLPFCAIVALALGHWPTLGRRLPPVALHAGREAAPAAFTAPHPAHCACSSVVACQWQAGARWAAVRGSALKSYDSALLQAGLLLPCATANQSWIELRATGSWKLCPVHSECRD
jgi:hypothetical protein